MLPSLTRARQAAKNASPALKFVVMVGIMSFFADFTYLVFPGYAEGVSQVQA